MKIKYFFTGLPSGVMYRGGASERPHETQVRIPGEIRSGLMRRVMPYSVLLPAGYESSVEPYPVLYLLHGLFGRHDDWLERTALAEQAAGHRLIIVTPEGGDGWYTDSATAEDDKYESYLLNELLPEIDSRYRTIRGRAGRAVAGLSMGGYGAFKLAFKRPELFALAASFSGAFDAPLLSDEAACVDWESMKPSVLRAFGAPCGVARAENDLYRIVVALPAETIPELPYFYFDCGTEDGFLHANLKMKDALAARGIPHQFEENAGGHDWDYWGGRVRPLLALAAEMLAQAGKV